MRYTICFLSTVDPMDQGSWSGITHHMFRALSQNNNVTWIGPVKFPKWARYIYSYWSKWNRLLKRKFTSHNFLYAFFSGRIIAKKIRNGNYDFIVVGAGEPELVAFLQTRIPIIYVADTTFARMVNYYPWHTGLCKSAIRQGNSIEKKAIDKSRHIIFSSEWAAKSGRETYGASTEKISVAPFGPSLSEIPEMAEIQLKSRHNECRLLFLGSHWERKGGPIAWEAYKQMKASGLQCSFTIVGCQPNLPPDNDCIVFPFLDKNKPDEMKTLYNIFMATDILILPSRADCTPVVFSEAAAFGIPVYTSDTGGISSIVFNGKNGFCLPYDAAPGTFSASIRKLWMLPNEFRLLSISSRMEYESRLNWEHWIEKFNQAIKSPDR